MSSIFRKTAMDKISSPEQLDKVVVITPPAFWLAMIGIAVIFITTLILSIFGRIPVKVNAGGIYMAKSGIHVLYARNGGIIEHIYVSDGDRVSKGDVILSFPRDELDKEHDDLISRREKVEKVTIDSKGDIPTADNRDLLELKSGMTADGSDSFKTQFEAAKYAVLDNLDNEIEDVELELKKTEILSDTDGYILGMNITEGNTVAQGSAICHIARENFRKRGANDPGNGEMAAILYIGVDNGRKIHEGMEVMVYPSTVNEQEYGHIKATVEQVEEYVTGEEEIKNMLGDDSIVQVFMQKGPVVQVICSLKPDPASKSGYEWSSKKGAEVELSPGTLLSADIITERKAPITILIPFLKEKLSVRVESDGGDS